MLAVGMERKIQLREGSFACLRREGREAEERKEEDDNRRYE